MKKILKNSVTILMNILIVIAVCILIILLYGFIETKVLKKKEYVDIFGYSMFQVVSGSMEETLHIGDLVIVKTREFEDIAKNDIIVFKQDETIITHRVIEIDKETITTKGDANNTKDEPIATEDVIGKVIKIIPNVAIWKEVFTSPQVLSSIIITILLFGMALSSKDGKDKEKEDEN